MEIGDGMDLRRCICEEWEEESADSASPHLEICLSDRKLSKLNRARVYSRAEFPCVSRRSRVKMLIRAKVRRAEPTKPCERFPCVSQIALLGASHLGGERAQAFETGTSQEVRLRYPPVLRDSRLQRLLRRSHGLQRRYEDCQHAQRALHSFRCVDRSQKESQCLQGKDVTSAIRLVVSRETEFWPGVRIESESQRE